MFVGINGEVHAPAVIDRAAAAGRILEDIQLPCARRPGTIKGLSDGAGTGWQPTPDRIGEKEAALRSGKRKYALVLAGVGMIICRSKRPAAESSAIGYLAAARIRQRDVCGAL